MGLIVPTKNFSTKLVHLTPLRATGKILKNQFIEPVVKVKSVHTEVGQEFVVSTKPFDEYKEAYLTEEYANKIKEFLNTAEFVPEGQRSVLFYGEKYK